MSKILAYRIESGWENNRWWYCPIEFRPELKKVEHLHTTRYLGSPPSVFRGAVSGLVFIAKGNSFPIESRYGRLLVAESEKPLKNLTNEAQRRLQWNPISEKDAIELIQSA